MAQRKRSFSVLLAIGLFKLFKAVLLLAVAIGAHRLLHRDIQDVLLDWIRKHRESWGAARRQHQQQQQQQQQSKGPGHGFGPFTTAEKRAV